MKFTAREQKFVFAGIALVVVIGLGFAYTLLSPSDDTHNVTNDIAKKQLAQQEGILSQKESYNTHFEEVKQRLDFNKEKLLPGDKANEADKKVQNLIKVSVHLEANCDPDKLIYFLAAINNFPYFLKVEELTIYSFNRRGSITIGSSTRGSSNRGSSTSGFSSRGSSRTSRSQPTTSQSSRTGVRASMTVVGYIIDPTFNEQSSPEPSQRAVAALRHEESQIARRSN